MVKGLEEGLKVSQEGLKDWKKDSRPGRRVEGLPRRVEGLEEGLKDWKKG